MAAVPALAPDRDTDGLTEDELVFWERAFLAVAASAIEAKNWYMDGKPVESGDKRMELCATWADSAITEPQAPALHLNPRARRAGQENDMAIVLIFTAFGLCAACPLAVLGDHVMAIFRSDV